jgi:hypothetical protein
MTRPSEGEPSWWKATAEVTRAEPTRAEIPEGKPASGTGTAATPTAMPPWAASPAFLGHPSPQSIGPGLR